MAVTVHVPYNPGFIAALCRSDCSASSNHRNAAALAVTPSTQRVTIISPLILACILCQPGDITPKIPPHIAAGHLTQNRNETMIYEIRFECSAESGTVMIAATTKKSALQQFADRYKDLDLDIPSHWVVGCWSRS